MTSQLETRRHYRSLFSLTVRAHLDDTLAEFRHLVHIHLPQLEVAHMRCVLEKYYNELKLLVSDDKTLREIGFYRSNKVMFAT